METVFKACESVPRNKRLKFESGANGFPFFVYFQHVRIAGNGFSLQFSRDSKLRIDNRRLGQLEAFQSEFFVLNMVKKIEAASKLDSRDAEDKLKLSDSY